MIKTTFDQLEPSIQEKLTRLDSLEASYKREGGNVVMYNGESFYTGKINVPEAPKQKTIYFSGNEIADMRDSLYSSTSKYKSASDTYMTMGKIYASNFKNLLTAVEPMTVFESDEDILLSRVYGNFYYFYTNSGNIYKITKNNTNNREKLNVLRFIKESFVPNLDARDVLCFMPYSTGYLVSTMVNGVYYVSDSHAELKFGMNDVFRMFVLPNKNVLCISHHEKPGIVFHDFESGKRVESSNILRTRDKQYPKDAILLDNGDFCVLGKPSGGNPSSSMLHYWKLDEAKIGYEYQPVAKNKASIFYEIKHLNANHDHIYVSGVNQNRLFVWIYDREDLRKDPVEVIFDKIRVAYDDLLYVGMADGEITFNVGGRMITINGDGEVLENLSLKGYDGAKTMSSDKVILCVKTKRAVSYAKQSYGYVPDISLEIFNGSMPCNNINIYMRSSDATERAAFFNADTLEQILPAYYGITSDRESIINLENCQAKRIIMKIACPKGNVIDGVVVNKNQLYMK